MKKITLVLGCLITFYGAIYGQTTEFRISSEPTSTAAAKDVVPGMAPISNYNSNISIPFTGTIGPNTADRNTQGLLFDNGSTFNVDGPPPISFLQDATLGMGTYGSNASSTNNYSVADDFILINDATISSIDVYAYQTGASAPSITAVYMRIWDGDPRSPSSTVVWGDLSTNVLSEAVGTGGYRQLESAPGDTSREIQKISANTAGVSLSAGSYWVEYSLDGTSASGPWVSPIVITGVATTGNAIQKTDTGWTAMEDVGRQGLPFQVYGDYSSNPFPEPYCGPLTFDTGVEPITNVVFAGIENASSAESSSPAHEDFTSVLGELELGQTYEITLEGNTSGSNTNNFTVFIDWNQNGSMDDEGERYEIGTITSSTGSDGQQAVASIEVPEDAIIGVTRMRIIKSSGSNYSDTSCSASSAQGQAEDYSLLVREEAIVLFPEPYCGPLTYGSVEPITRVVFAGIDNSSSAATTSPAHEDFTDVEGNVMPGASYDIALEGNTAGASYTNSFTVFIDWNQDGVLDNDTERYEIGTIVGSTGTDGQQAVSTIAVPDSALSGTTRMRVIKKYTQSYATSSCDPGSSFGQAEDYTILVGGMEDCSGTPDGGEVAVDPQIGNTGSTYTVSASGFSTGNGTFYQWQSNTDGTGWEDEGDPMDAYSDFNATAPADSGVEVEWRLRVTCTFSGETSYSETATFTTSSGQTYCIPEPAAICSDGDLITNVTFQEIDNETDCSPDGYGDYTDMVATVQAGGTYPISVSVGNGFSSESVSVWIDFDSNGTFDEDEFFFIGTGSGSTVSNEITIPTDAENGEYRMRVRVAAASGDIATWDLACGDDDQIYGETEDYTVSVDGVVGTNDFSSIDFTYYPNPMGEILYINSRNVIQSVSAYNIIGQQVLSARSNDGRVDVSSLPTGTFFFRVIFESGQMENFKVLKK